MSTVNRLNSKESSALNLFLNQKVTAISGIGEKRRQALGELNISTLLDLLLHLPSRYRFRKPVKSIANLGASEIGVVEVEVQAQGELRKLSGKRTVLHILVADDSESAVAVWFNQPYRQYQFREGLKIWLEVKNEFFRGRRFLQVRESGLGPAPPSGLVPVYALRGQMPQNQYLRLVKQVLELFSASAIPDIWPSSFLHSQKLLSLGEALQQIHRPISVRLLDEARRRLSFDQTSLERGRSLQERRSLSAVAQPGDEVMEAKWRQALPYKLTESQESCIEEIYEDMSQNRPMRRLLQGDVGSGKTVVAAAAIVRSLLSGKNAVLLAPTEVLARQHYHALQTLLPPQTNTYLELGGYSTSQTTSAQEASLWVGTHALLEEKRSIDNLGLVVIDEQHRFGVMQREKLLDSRTPSPHMLCLSATPIPRSLAMMLYGDLDSSIISMRPQLNRKVQTVWLKDETRLPAFFDFCRGEFAAGHKLYWVCPSIDADPDLELSSVTLRLPSLKEIWPETPPLAIHGRMSSQARQEALESFLYGEAQLLIGTTVVEVGLDQPLATVIVIENAECFGLAQLHQLRGRVGRSDLRSYCVLLSGSLDQLREGRADDLGKEATARLQALCDSDDGFELARLDLQLRGPGEVLGVAQSGFADSFALTWPLSDSDMSAVEAYLQKQEKEELAKLLWQLDYRS